MEIHVTDWCPECDEELTITVGLKQPDFCFGPIDYCEVVGEWVDRCPVCGIGLPPEMFQQAAETALETERLSPRRRT